MKQILHNSKGTAVETRTHCLSREKVNIESSSFEELNVNFDIEYKMVQNESGIDGKVQIFFDINTLAEHVSHRINSDNVSSYFSALKGARDQILEGLL